MIIYFTRENTANFTDGVLHYLNQAANEQITNDMNDDQIKNITDQILNDQEQYTGKI